MFEIPHLSVKGNQSLFCSLTQFSSQKMRMIGQAGGERTSTKCYAALVKKTRCHEYQCSASSYMAREPISLVANASDFGHLAQRWRSEVH